MKRLPVAAAVAAAVAGTLVAAGFAAAGAATAPAAPAVDTISTVVGGAGGPDAATNVAMIPCGVRYQAGALYIGSGGSVIHRVDPATDWLTTVAGDNAIGAAATGVKATSTDVGGCNTTVDSHGNLVFASGDTIYVVAKSSGTFYGKKMTAGNVYQVASFGFFGPIADVEIGQGGNLLVTLNGAQLTHTTYGGSRIYVVAEHPGTFYGQKMTAGHQYAIAGEVYQTNTPNNGEVATTAWLGSNIGNLRTDSSGNLVFADASSAAGSIFEGAPGALVRVIAEKSGTFYGLKMRPGRIYDIAGNYKLEGLHPGGNAGNGVPATDAELYAAGALTLDSHGNVLISDWGQVRVVAVHSGSFYGKAMRAGYIYTIAGTTEPSVVHNPVYSGNGGPALKATFASESIGVDGNGNVILASNDLRVLAIAEKTGTFYGQKMHTGDIYTVAGNGDRVDSGDGGAATSAEIYPDGVAYDRADGLTLVLDLGDNPLVYASSVRAVASKTGTYFGRAMTAGHIYTIAGGRVITQRSGVPATSAGFFWEPGTQVAATSAGNLVIPQNQFNTVQVVADKSGTFYGQSMKAGYVYTIAGNGTAGYSGDGGPALAAELNGADSAAVDANGNILLADLGRVRVIAATTGTFYGMAMTAGDIYTIAGDGGLMYSGDGGPALAAGVAPDEVTLDKAGNVLISDANNHRIRVLAARTGMSYGVAMTAGDIYTIAGNGSCGGPNANGVLATSASICGGNLQAAVDPAGNVVMNDNTIQMVASATGTFYGMKMTAGDLYTIGGTSIPPEVFGDGGPATKAFLNALGLAVTPAGNVLVVDGLSFRIRSIQG